MANEIQYKDVSELRGLSLVSVTYLNVSHYVKRADAVQTK